MKDNKAITLIALIITIVVMIIIASITIYSGGRAIKKAKFEDVKTNMLQLQAEIKNYTEQAKFEGKDTIDGIELNGVKLSIKQSNKVEGFYEINTDMAALNLPELSSYDYLISFDIDKVDADVYFVPGIRTIDSNTTFYKLSQIEEAEL